jgi:hypothetical protein
MVDVPTSDRRDPIGDLARSLARTVEPMRRATPYVDVHGLLIKEFYESLDAVYAALPETLRDEAILLWRSLSLNPTAVEALATWEESHGFPLGDDPRPLPDEAG